MTTDPETVGSKLPPFGATKVSHWVTKASSGVAGMPCGVTKVVHVVTEMRVAGFGD